MGNHHGRGLFPVNCATFPEQPRTIAATSNTQPLARSSSPCWLPSGYDARVQLFQEFQALIRRTWTLWRTYLPQIATWLLLGWTIYIVCLLTSATLGNSFAPLGVLVFVLGVSANVVSVIFAIHSLKPGLRTAERLANGEAGSRSAGDVPAAVFTDERKLDVAILAIGPVLGVYAAWAILDQMISDGLLWNAVIRDIWGFSEFSISRSLDALPFYAALGVAALVIRWLYGRVIHKRSSTWWKLPLVFLESLWVFAFFFIVLLGLRGFQTWLARRAFWREGLHLWHRILDSLPDLALPFDLTLPALLQKFTIWLTESFVPGLWEGIALPLVWLAVAAIVFGWRSFRAQDLFTTSVKKQELKTEEPTGNGGPLDGVVTFLLTDLREKWLPLLHTFRLVWRAGPYVLGSYLVLSAVVAAADWALNALLSRMLASDTQARALRAFNGIDVIQHVVITSVSLCLYAATFDRGLAAAAGLPVLGSEGPTDPGNERQMDSAQTESVNVQ